MKLCQDLEVDDFLLCGSKGKLKAKWLDSYLGLFQIEGEEGFMMAKDIMMRNDIYCEFEELKIKEVE
jgi:hypothetical protein